MKDDVVILIAEDDPDDVLIAKEALNEVKIPAQPRFVADGQEAIAYLSGEGPYADRADIRCQQWYFSTSACHSSTDSKCCIGFASGRT